MRKLLRREIKQYKLVNGLWHSVRHIFNIGPDFYTSSKCLVEAMSLSNYMFNKRRYNEMLEDTEPVIELDKVA